MIKGFAHVCLSARDLTASTRFYCEGLGFLKRFEFIRKDRVIGCYLEIKPGAYIEIFQQDQIDPDAKTPIRHFCLESDDLDQVATRLQANGYEATAKKLGADGSWQLWTTDPSGVRIEFHQYTDKSSQITHQNCVLA